MYKYVAKLTGEEDGHTVTRRFDTIEGAKVWLQEEGLDEFDDQTARGEVFSGDGQLVWTRSNLKSPIQAAHEWARLGFEPYARRGLFHKFKKGR
jgi:hypothetical protein